MKATKVSSENVIKRLFALSRNVCAFPNCTTAIVQPTGTVTGKICHIKAKSLGGPRYDSKQTDKERNSFENLILLCGVHHDIVDDRPEEFTVEVLLNMKEMHERNGDTKLSQENARLVHRLIASSNLYFGARCEAQVMVGSPGSIQTKNLIIKMDKKPSRPIIIPGTVGEDARMYGYLNYLARRYNGFKNWEYQEGKLAMNYALIHVAYKREMKYSIKDTPRNMFYRAVEFLQKRISNTKLGRIMKSRGQEIFSSFETFDQTK